ncbi:hypothetical protein [Morganella morganii IS15]|nr:hypothetical protein [Morganella morganii IS15]
MYVEPIIKKTKEKTAKEREIKSNTLKNLYFFNIISLFNNIRMPMNEKYKNNGTRSTKN